MKLVPSRDLCGATEAEFADLLVRLAPLAEADKRARETRQGRKRAPGAGAKPRPFAFRLLVALTHLRQGLALRPSGAIFGVDEKSVRNWRDELARLLLAHGIEVPGRAPIRSLEDLAGYLRDDERAVLVDGVEVPRPRPGGGWEGQRSAYSGKSKRHVVKATVLTDEQGAPLWFEANPSGEGRTHDITMLRAQAGVLAVLGTAWLVLADRGYQGLGHDIGADRVATPVFRRAGRTLSDEDRLYNRDQAGLRIKVEHAIGHMKVWRAMRHHRRPPERFNETGRAIATLVSILR
ncbi:MAG: transposase [Dietzia sp.]|nr:transposase [Dietzia sp.]